MAECQLSISNSSYWLRAEGVEGFKLDGAALLSVNVIFSQATGEIESATIECHPDTPQEVQSAVRRLFLHLDICINDPQE